MEQQLVTINGLSYGVSTRIGECGANPEWKKNKKIYFPMFLLGTCGDDDGVVCFNGITEILVAPKTMNYNWFKLLALKLKNHPFLDWDWDSFTNNILKPNREHLKIALNIDDNKLTKLLIDGYVFINNFERDWDIDDEDDLNAKKRGLNYPNFKNFLEKDKLEY